MSVEKARKIAAARKKVRESDQLDSILKSQRIKKLINPTERPRRQDERFECNQVDTEDESDDETGSELGADDAFEYWGAVLAELDGDEDVPPPNHRAVVEISELSADRASYCSDSDSRSRPILPADRGSDEAERAFRDKIIKLRSSPRKTFKNLLRTHFLLLTTAIFHSKKC